MDYSLKFPLSVWNAIQEYFKIFDAYPSQENKIIMNENFLLSQNPPMS